MKRLVTLLALLCFVAISVFALEASVSWNWYKNDRNVKYFRYQLDAEDEDNWTVVKSNVLEATFDVDVSIVHVLYLQQSYDGIHWSESSYTESEVYTDVDFGDEEDFSYDFEDETPVIIEVPEEVVEEVPVEQKKSTGKSFFDVSLSYRNSIPNQAVSKDIGFVASYTYLFPVSFVSTENFASGFHSELGFYTSEELFTIPSNTDYFVVASFHGAVNFSPSRGDITVSFGPECQFKFGSSNPIFYFGLNSRIEMRFSLSEKYSVGISIANHYYFYPEKINLYDLSASFSINM